MFRKIQSIALTALLLSCTEQDWNEYISYSNDVCYFDKTTLNTYQPNLIKILDTENYSKIMQYLEINKINYIESKNSSHLCKVNGENISVLQASFSVQDKDYWALLVDLYFSEEELLAVETFGIPQK